jgi:mono/diheme cytochrome c family protein
MRRFSLCEKGFSRRTRSFPELSLPAPRAARKLLCYLSMNSFSFQPSRLAAALWLLVSIAMTAFAGCSRETSDPRLIPAKELVRLADARVRTETNVPPRIVKQIHDSLEYYFGTPNEPRMYEPAKAAEGETTGSEGDEPTSTDEANTQQTKAPKRASQKSPEQLKRGLAVFTKRCAACHGAMGDGAGPVAAYLHPRPRDYRLGIFKFTSTPYGSKPRRADLIRTILRGAKGTSMPAFPFLEEEDLQAVIDYVVMLSQRGEVEQLLLAEGESFDPETAEEMYAPEDIAAFVTQVAGNWREAEHNQVIPLTSQPAYTEESIAAGRDIFMKNECFKCHGTDGRGQTPEPVGKDAWTGEGVYAADLSSGMLHGGRRPVDIYRRIYSGINGTPMPSCMEKFKDEPDAIWHLVHFIISITEGRTFSAGSSAPVTPTPITSTPSASTEG